ncbi:T9SS type A sorting domain-containing protein [Flavobacterium sp. WC2509]|uniref:T9SS type A sorting domain-containing protein n=1 Tax=Flavobacterium sp. WC2509 TaxID=3461406 RepID=UPI004043B872
MKKNYLFILCVFFMSNFLRAQTTETFETETQSATNFTDNGQVFNITSQSSTFAIQGAFPGTGWNGSAADNKYIDNNNYTISGQPVQFTISSAGNTAFALKNIYLYLATNTANINVTGSVTITGKLAGATQFTATSSSGFNTSMGVANGFTLINMATFGAQNNSNIAIDQYVISTTGNIAYVSLDAMTWQKNIPTVTTTTATGVGAVKATLGGNVTSIGESAVTERGIVWATTANPTTANTKVTNGTGTGSFSALISSLPPGTLVHFRAYATNTEGTGYGSDLTFTTNAALSATTSQTNIFCNGRNNGTASVTASGGVAPYTYAWSPSGGSGSSAIGLGATTYTCTITDNESTQITRNVTITQPTAIYMATASQTNVSCNGGTNGSASVTPSGGTGAYTYSWSPSGRTTATATGLAAGSYTVTVTDANSCTATRNFTITQPTAISTAIGSQTNVSCNGGTNGAASVTPSGGTPGYTYSWSPSGGTAATATGLSAGTYTVTVTDANSCTKTATVTITQPAPIDLTVTSTGVTLTAIQLGATYQWYKCSDNSPVGTNSSTFTPSQSGDYKVAITLGSCTLTSNCITVATLGTTRFETNSKLSIYPNPSQGIINVESDSNGDYLVVNQQGQIVKTFKIEANVINTIDLQNLNDSVYFIKEISNTNNKSSKLIIKK